MRHIECSHSDLSENDKTEVINRACRIGHEEVVNTNAWAKTNEIQTEETNSKIGETKIDTNKNVPAKESSDEMKVSIYVDAGNQVLDTENICIWIFKCRFCSSEFTKINEITEHKTTFHNNISNFTSFPSGQFTTEAIVNPSDEKLVNFTSVQCSSLYSANGLQTLQYQQPPTPPILPAVMPRHRFL